MSFCLLRRDGDAVALIAATLFSTRAEALAEISRLSAGDGIDADEVFLVDIDAAMPVLIVPQPATAEAPHATAEETLHAPEETSDATAASESTTPASVLEVETAIAEAVLAGSEAPETEAEVPQAPEEASDEEQVPAADLSIAEDETPEEPSDDAGAEAPEETEAATAGAPQSWPWDVQVPIEEETLLVVEESVEIATVPSADLSEPPQEVDEAAESLPIDTGPASEDREFSEDEPTSDEVEPEAEPEEIPDEVEPEPELEVADSDDVPLPDEVSGLLADLEELVPAVSVASAAREAAPTKRSEPASGSLDPEPALPEEPPRAYEAGSSDITELTCEDCIYLNTCPKKDESDPSSCGSFQWKSI
jgi:hypothetical protein